MNAFLKLKHWQLFLLMFAIPFFVQAIVMTLTISNHNPRYIGILFPVVMLLYIGPFWGWFYALGINLNKKLPETVKMNLSRFKLFLFIPGIYILFLMSLLFAFFSGFSIREINPLIVLVIIPIHLFSIFCIFYCLYFNAKSLKAVELQKPVTFNDYSGEFFLIWFFFIGVWFIQPRINKLFADTNQE